MITSCSYRRAIVFLALSLLLPASALATNTLYVRSTAPDDLGVVNGNPATPDDCWRTIGGAVGYVQTTLSPLTTPTIIEIVDSATYTEAVDLVGIVTDAINTLTIQTALNVRPTWRNDGSTVLFNNADGINSFGALRIAVPNVTVDGIDFTGTSNHGVYIGAIDVTIRHCIFHDLIAVPGNYNHNSCAIWGTASNTRIYNNVFYNVVYAMRVESGPLFVRNNIFSVNNVSGTVEIAFLSYMNFANGTPDSDYNVFQIAGGNRLALAWFPGTGYNNLAAWQGAAIVPAPDPNSLSGNPLFVTAGTNFHLQSTFGHWTAGGWVADAQMSPAIDAGEPYNAALEWSFFANEPHTNGGQVNIGAYGNTNQASLSGVVPVCGNGALEEGETCDDGAANGTTTCGCQLGCVFAPNGIDCGTCCKCSAGARAYDNTQSADCAACKTCSALDTCGNATDGTDPKGNCTAGACDACYAGACGAAPGTCLITGACYNNGDDRPGNNCQWCATATSQIAWTNKAAATDCGTCCTCSAGARAYDSAQSADCAACKTCSALDTCGNATDGTDPKGDCSIGTCDACYGGACGLLPGTCLLAGICYNDGDERPGNNCQWCNTATSQIAWIDKPPGADCGTCCTCSTGTRTYDSAQNADCAACKQCSGLDACAGVADGTDPKGECSAGTCDACYAGACGPSAGMCLIAGACYAAGEERPGNNCEWCDPGTSQSGWTGKPAGTDCGTCCTCVAGARTLDSAQDTDCVRCQQCGAVDTCAPVVPLATPDPSCDGIDDNCNGLIDEDVDLQVSCPPAAGPCEIVACSPVVGQCERSTRSDCCEEDAQCAVSSACWDATCDLGTHTCNYVALAGCCTSDANCALGGQCTAATCDLGTGTCQQSPIAGCCTTNADCDDADPCSYDECTPVGWCRHRPATCGTPGPCGANTSCVYAALFVGRGPKNSHGVKVDGRTRAAVFQISFTTEGVGGTLTELWLKVSGLERESNQYRPEFLLYRDTDANGVVDAQSEPVVRAAQVDLSSGRVSFGQLQEPLGPGEQRNLLVVVELAPIARMAGVGGQIAGMLALLGLALLTGCGASVFRRRVLPAAVALAMCFACARLGYESGWHTAKMAIDSEEAVVVATQPDEQLQIRGVPVESDSFDVRW